MPYKIVKSSGDKVAMEKSDFAKEHVHLIGLLKRHSAMDPAVATEMRKQKKELAKVEKATKSGYYVVNTETGRRFSNAPLSLGDAKAQLRILEKHRILE